MTFFTQANKEALHVDPANAAQGPEIGFLESFKVSWEAQARGSSQFGIEYSMNELHWKQNAALKDAGVESVPELTEFSAKGVDGYEESFTSGYDPLYLEAAKMSAGEGTGSRHQARISAYDKRIDELKIEYPDLQLMNTAEMFGDVKEKAQKAEHRLHSDRRTWGGAFGDFAGGALASMDPRTDPLNFATLGVGGAGKTAAVRIASQFGSQGVIEGINQVTGVQANREMLGLSHGVGDAAMRVGFTALGGAALQSVGELAVAGARKLFKGKDSLADKVKEHSVPETKEPLRPETLKEQAQAAQVGTSQRAYDEVLTANMPHVNNRADKANAAADLEDMSSTLADWNATEPANVKPKVPVDPRDVDPLAFKKYDALVDARNIERATFKAAQGRKSERVAVALQAVNSRIDALKDKIKTTKSVKGKKSLRAELKKATAAKKDLDSSSKNLAKSKPDSENLRKKAEEVAPQIARAVERARGRWEAPDESIAAVMKAFERGDDVFVMPKIPDELMGINTKAVEDSAPPIHNTEGAAQKGNAAETASAVMAENAKVMDAAFEAYRGSIPKILSDDGTGTITLPGHDEPFALDTDTIWVPNEHGDGGNEIPIRKLLEQQRDADLEIEAISSCSIL